MCKVDCQVSLHQQMWFVSIVAFPFIAAPLAEIVPNKRRDQMNHFFTNTIQKIIKQREEQPPDQVMIFMPDRLLIGLKLVFQVNYLLLAEASRLPSADVGCPKQQGVCGLGAL